MNESLIVSALTLGAALLGVAILLLVERWHISWIKRRHLDESHLHPHRPWWRRMFRRVKPWRAGR